MEASLSSLLAVLRQARDFIVTEGPPTLYNAAEVLARMSEAARQIGRYIEQYGPQVQFSPGAPPPQLSAETQRNLDELKLLGDEAEAKAAELEKAADDFDPSRPPGFKSPPSPQALNPLVWLMLAKLLAGLIRSATHAADARVEPTMASETKPNEPSVQSAKGYTTGTGPGDMPPAAGSKKSRR